MTLTEPYHAIVQGSPQDDTERWTIFDADRVFECKIAIVRESEGFSVHAEDLLGVVSQGETVEEAVENITEAFGGALTEYLANGVIPWEEVAIEGEIECRKRILVNV